MLEICFALLNKKNWAYHSASIKYTTKGITENMICMTLSINSYKITSLSTNVSKI